jgi:hypothetical protein
VLRAKTCHIWWTPFHLQISLAIFLINRKKNLRDDDRLQSSNLLAGYQEDVSLHLSLLGEMNTNSNDEEPSSSFRPVDGGSDGEKNNNGKEAVALQAPIVAATHLSLNQQGNGIGRQGLYYTETPIPGAEKYYDWRNLRYIQSASLCLAPNIVLGVPEGISCIRNSAEKTINIEQKWRDVHGNSATMFCLIACWVLSFTWAIASVNPIAFMLMMVVTAQLFCFLPLWFSIKKIEISPTQITTRERAWANSNSVFYFADTQELICQRRVWKKPTGGNGSQRKIDITYEVLMKLKDGSHKFLMVGLETAEMALFMQQEIERMRAGTGLNEGVNNGNWEVV